LSLKGVI